VGFVYPYKTTAGFIPMNLSKNMDHKDVAALIIGLIFTLIVGLLIGGFLGYFYGSYKSSSQRQEFIANGTLDSGTTSSGIGWKVVAECEDRLNSNNPLGI
jgi:hypothetical protein